MALVGADGDTRCSRLPCALVNGQLVRVHFTLCNGIVYQDTANREFVNGLVQLFYGDTWATRIQGIVKLIRGGRR